METQRRRGNNFLVLIRPPVEPVEDRGSADKQAFAVSGDIAAEPAAAQPATHRVLGGTNERADVDRGQPLAARLLTISNALLRDDDLADEGA
jgi:hypothetical protein